MGGIYLIQNCFLDTQVSPAQTLQKTLQEVKFIASHLKHLRIVTRGNKQNYEGC